MFIVPRSSKMGIMIFAGLCIYEYKLSNSFPLGATSIILPLCFLASEYKLLIKKIKRASGHYILLYHVLLISTIYVVYTIFVSPHLHNSSSFFYIIKNFVCRYLLFFIPIVCVSSRNDIKIVYKWIFIGIIVMSIFAFLNVVYQHSVYVDWLVSGQKVSDYMEEAGGMFESKQRFRVQGTFHNPFDYGYSCIVCFLMFWYGYIKKYCTKTTFTIVAGCSFLGIITCNCRTVLFCAILVVCTFIMFNLKKVFRFRSVVVAVGFVALLIGFVPPIHDSFRILLSALNDNSEIRGSSISFRELQFFTVLKYIDGSLLLGRGYNFFRIDLKGSEGISGRVTDDLGMMEGSYLNTLLDTGIIGTIFYFSIIIALLIFSWNRRNADVVSASLMFSVTFLFLIFGILTGELRSAYLSFIVIGFAYKQLIQNGYIRKTAISNLRSYERVI